MAGDVGPRSSCSRCSRYSLLVVKCQVPGPGPVSRFNAGRRATSRAVLSTGYWLLAVSNLLAVISLLGAASKY
jgi:hypothetical protein